MNEGIDFTVKGVMGVPDYRGRIYRKKSNRTALLIPIINEGSRILNQIANLNLAQLNVDIVIADGGSEDMTQEKLEIEKLNVNAFLTKEGKGALSAQLRMGFHFCLSEKYESIITMDGNGKDDPSYIPIMLRKLDEGFDFIQGSRFILNGVAENTPTKRMLAIKLVHAPLTSISARTRFTDTTNGFRGFSSSALMSEEVDIFRPIFEKYELLAYLPIRISRIGMKVAEIPAARRYPKHGQIPTKIKGLKAEVGILLVLIRVMLGKYNPKNGESR